MYMCVCVCVVEWRESTVSRALALHVTTQIWSLYGVLGVTRIISEYRSRNNPWILPGVTPNPLPLSTKNTPSVWEVQKNIKVLRLETITYAFIRHFYSSPIIWKYQLGTAERTKKWKSVQQERNTFGILGLGSRDLNPSSYLSLTHLIEHRLGLVSCLHKGHNNIM